MGGAQLLDQLQSLFFPFKHLYQIKSERDLYISIPGVRHWGSQTVTYEEWLLFHLLELQSLRDPQSVRSALLLHLQLLRQRRELSYQLAVYAIS